MESSEVDVVASESSRLAELRARAQQNMADPALGDSRRRHTRQLQLDQLEYEMKCIKERLKETEMELLAVQK